MDLSIIHPFDPWRLGLGGFDSFLDGFFRYAPTGWRIEVIGVSRDTAARPVGRTTRATIHGRRIDFHPVLHDSDPYWVRRVPLALRFAAAARRRGVRPRGSIVQFHRFESRFAVKLKRGSRAVCFLHNHPPAMTSSASDIRWRKLDGVFYAALRSSLASMDAVWSVDPRTPEWLAGFSPRHADRVFHQPVWADPAIFQPGSDSERERARADLRSTLDLDPSEKICLFAGRLETQKDPELLVDAFAEVAARLPDVSLLFVGRGRLQDLLRSCIEELGLAPRTRWMDAVDRQDLAKVYRGVDLSVCCSAFESGPRNVFESLACGTPVVSFDVGQVAAALRPLADLELLVEQRDAGALAAAIERGLSLAATPELRLRLTGAVANATPRHALAELFRLYETWLGAAATYSLRDVHAADTSAIG